MNANDFFTRVVEVDIEQQEGVANTIFPNMMETFQDSLDEGKSYANDRDYRSLHDLMTVVSQYADNAKRVFDQVTTVNDERYREMYESGTAFMSDLERKVSVVFERDDITIDFFRVIPESFYRNGTIDLHLDEMLQIPSMDISNLRPEDYQEEDMGNGIWNFLPRDMVPNRKYLGVGEIRDEEIYIGEWIVGADGTRTYNGRGIEYFPHDGYIYIGTFVDGQRTGFGVNFRDTQLRIGMWSGGMISGPTIDWRARDYVYRGMCASGEPNGLGVEREGDNLGYFGYYHDGYQEGLVMVKYYRHFSLANRTRSITSGLTLQQNGPVRESMFTYIGNVQDSLRNGYGISFYNSIYAGEWVNDLEEGLGIVFNGSNEYYLGTWVGGSMKGNMIHYNNGDYTLEEWDRGREIHSRPITEAEAHALPLSEEKTLPSESSWWEVICRIEEQPKEKLYDIFHVLLDQAYTESLVRRNLDPDLEFALEVLQDLPREELEALSKEELCQSIREVWELWKKANRDVGCVNPESMLTGQRWGEMNPDEVFVIPTRGVNYCFTAEELSRLERNPYTGERFPQEVRDRLHSRAVYLEQQHIQKEVEEEEHAPPPPIPVYSQLRSSFERLGLLEYLEQTEGRLKLIRDKVYDRLKEKLEKLKEENSLPIRQKIVGYDEEKKQNIYDLRTPQEEVDYRLRKGVYGHADRNPLNLNTWLLQILQTNSDLGIQELVREAIVDAFEEELPELPAEYKETIPQSLRESLEIIERYSEASHLDYRAIMEYSQQVRGLIVEYIRANAIDADLRINYTLYDTAHENPTPENIGNFLRDIYRRNDQQRDTLRAFSLNLRPILEGTEEGVMANLIALLPRGFVRRVIGDTPQDVILTWIEDTAGEEFNSVTEVQDLDLSEQELRELPENLAELVNLERIYLDENSFEALPLVLGRLPELEYIEARSNPITNISNQFPIMPNLTSLKLDHNTQLTQLPERFGEIFPNLRRLYLRGTGLTTFPESFYTLTNLEVLDIRHTPLTEETRTRLQRMGIRQLNIGNAQPAPAQQPAPALAPVRVVPVELSDEEDVVWYENELNFSTRREPIVFQRGELDNNNEVHWNEIVQGEAYRGDDGRIRIFDEEGEQYYSIYEYHGDGIYYSINDNERDVLRFGIPSASNFVPNLRHIAGWTDEEIDQAIGRSQLTLENLEALSEYVDLLFTDSFALQGSNREELDEYINTHPPSLPDDVLFMINIRRLQEVPRDILEQRATRLLSRRERIALGSHLLALINARPERRRDYEEDQPPPAREPLAPENVAWFSDEIQLPEDPRRRRVIYQLGEVDEGDQIQWFVERIEHGMAYLDEAKVRVIHGDREGDVLLARFTYETDGIYLSEDGDTALRFGYQVSSEPIARNLQAIGEWYENEIKRIDERYLSLDDRIDLANFLALLDTRISAHGMENASRDQIVAYLERREMWPPDSLSILRRFQRLRRMSERDLIRNINQLLTPNQRGTLARILTIMLENRWRDFFQELTEDDVTWYEYETVVPRSPQRLSVIYQIGDIDEDDGSIEWHEEERDGEWFPLIEQGLAYLDDDGTVRILDSGDNLLLPRFVFSQDGLYFSTAGDMVLHFGRLRAEPDEARMERLFRRWLREHQDVLEDSPENATRENLNDVIEWIRVRDSELVNGFYRTQIKAMFRDFLEGELNVEESEEEEKAEAREEPEEEDFESVLVDDTLPIFVDDEVWNQLLITTQRQYILNYMKLVLDMLAREDQEFESIAETNLDTYLRDPNELSVQGHNLVPYQNYPPNNRVWRFYDEHKENVGAMAILLTKLRQRYPNNLASQDAYLRRLKERIEGQDEIDLDSFDLLDSVNLLIGLVERQQLLGENPRIELEALANNVPFQNQDELRMSRERKRTDLMAYVLLHFTRDLWTEWNYEAIKERATRIRSQIRGGYGDRFSAFTAEYRENTVFSAIVLANLIYRWLGPDMYQHLREFADIEPEVADENITNAIQALIQASQNNEDPLHDLINAFEDYLTNAV